MVQATYQKLALQWSPQTQQDRVFFVVAIVVVVLVLFLGAFLNSIDIPEKPRQQKSEIPERVAKFITKKEKPKPPPPPPKPKPVQPKPEPKPVEPEKPKIEKKRPQVEKKPLTEEQKKARDVAKETGLLALSAELNDLIDTADAAQQVKSAIKGDGSSKEVAGHSADVLTKNATKGSGGVDGTKYKTTAGESQLSAAEQAAAIAALSAAEQAFDDSVEEDATRRDSKLRSQEEVTLVIDRKKSQLQSLYNRARRSNPSLKGKLVLAITILPNGTVSDVEVISSELNDSTLEQRIVARVKTFNFGEKDVDIVTVNYPIEFSPY